METQTAAATPVEAMQPPNQTLERVVAAYFSALRESNTYFRALSTIFSKMALREEEVFVAGSEAAVRWTGVAILRTNPREVDFEGISVFEINEQGRIQSVRSYWDKATLMARL